MESINQSINLLLMNDLSGSCYQSIIWSKKLNVAKDNERLDVL